MSLVMEKALDTVRRISQRLNIPPPRVVLTKGGEPYYENGTIYLPENLSPDMIERVVAHEMAHHYHMYFGVMPSVETAEKFASMFEEVYVRARERGYAYTRLYRPSPDIGKAIALGVLGGLTAYFLTPKINNYLRRYIGKELKPEESAALTTAFVTFLSGLIL
jgi:hypothetical protein